MRKSLDLLILTAIVLVVIGLPCAYGIHLYRNYVRIQNELRDKSSRIVRPKVDDESVSEIGYIYDMRRETYLREGRLNLVWFIVVPSENTRWSCSYQGGFPDLKVGDGVTIIHKRTGVDGADYGYVVGLHDKAQGKATEVWVIDLEELEMDIIDD